MMCLSQPAKKLNYQRASFSVSCKDFDCFGCVYGIEPQDMPLYILEFSLYNSCVISDSVF